jgi:hypothetical protein
MTSALRRPRVRIVLALVLIALAAGAGVGVYTQASAFSYEDLLSALTAHGAAVREAGTASTLTFRGAGHGLMINGSQVAAYAYRTTVAAQLDAARVSSDGSTFHAGYGPFGGNAVTVDWIAAPHHYLRGRVIVTYIGDDVTIMRLLTSVLGPQFAGGAVPNGNGYLWLLGRLQAAGATVALLQHRPNQPVFAGTQPTTDVHDISVNGTTIGVFEFANDQAAVAYASHITAGGDYLDPAAHRDLIVEYAAPPHFYHQGTIVVLSVGSDGQTMQLLASVLGPPVTGGHA